LHASRVVSLLSASINKLDLWAARLEARIDDHPRWYLFLFSLFYLSVTLPITIIRQMWFDELITFYTVRFHSLSHLWATLRAGVDMNPPLYHLIVRASETLLGENELGLRLPSLVAYWVMTVGLYLLARRRVRPLYATLAALFPLLTMAHDYASEARPYAIVLACCVLMLLCWQRATEATPRRMALVGLSLSLAVAMCNHYYASLLVVPIAVGELVRSRDSRKLDWPVWIALVVGAVPLPFFLPLVRGGMAAHKDPFVWNKPGLDFLWDTYGELLSYAALPVLLLIAWMFVRSVRNSLRKSEPRNNGIPDWEIAAGLALCALPILAFVLALAWVGMVSPRYVMPTIIGFSIVLAYTAHSIAGARRATAVLMLAGLTGWSAVHLGLVGRFELAMLHRFDASDSERFALGSKLPVIVQDALLELPMNHYVSPELRSRMLFPLDLDDVHRYAEIGSAEKLLMIIARNTFPVPVTDFNQFRRDHKRYLVYGQHAGWLITTVIRDGASVRMLYLGRWQILFLVNEKAQEANPAAPALAAGSPFSHRGSQSAALTRARMESHP